MVDPPPLSGSYTTDGAKGVVAQGGSARVAAVTALITSLGGTVESFYFGFGSDDFHVTITFNLSGTVSTGLEYHLDLFSQPMIEADGVRVQVHSDDPNARIVHAPAGHSSHLPCPLGSRA